jgi:hypothetical protein
MSQVPNSGNYNPVLKNIYICMKKVKEREMYNPNICWKMTNVHEFFKLLDLLSGHDYCVAVGINKYNQVCKKKKKNYVYHKKRFVVRLNRMNDIIDFLDSIGWQGNTERQNWSIEQIKRYLGGSFNKHFLFHKTYIQK